MQKELNQFFKLVDKRVAKKKNSTEKESLHNEYISLFFDEDNDVLNRIREEEQNWKDTNTCIEIFNEIFSKDLEDIELSNYLDYDSTYRINRKRKENELIFQFSFDNDIKIEEKFFDDVIEKDNGDIEIKYKSIYKKDSSTVQLQKEEFNKLLQNAVEIEDFKQFLTVPPLIEKDVSDKGNKVIIKFKLEPIVIIKPEYQDFIKIQKDKVIFKKQNIIKNPFLEDEKYFLIKLQDEAKLSAFHKYKVFKEIFTYFKNSIATKTEKITYTPDDLAEFSSELLYKILEKLNFFNNKKIVFADYLCGSGNLAMNFIKVLEQEDRAKDIEHIYLNDKNPNFEIGNILNEYLKKVWKTLPLNPISEVNISENTFPLLEEKDIGGGYKGKILPNVIMSNPDFNNEVEKLKNIFIEKSNNQAILLLYYGKILNDIEGYVKLVIKLDSSELFLNTSSKVYINIYIPSLIANNKIKSHFINLPDVEKYFCKMNDPIWKDKKRKVKESLIAVLLTLIFEKEIKDFIPVTNSTYAILDKEVLLSNKTNNKSITVSDNQIFIDEEKEVLFEFQEYDSNFTEIIEEENYICYISKNENNCFKIPILSGNVDNILMKKYEELKRVL